MARWEITGADRLTGNERIFSIDAPNEHDARSRATGRGVLVASIVCKVPDAPTLTENVIAPESYSALFNRIYLDEPTLTENVIAPSPESIDGETPNYSGIDSSGVALRAFASVCNALAVIWFVLGVISCAVAAFHGDVYMATIGMVGCSITGFLFLVLAALIEMFTSIGEAVRDTARNSFKNQSRR